jgi:hypothetical protein
VQGLLPITFIDTHSCEVARTGELAFNVVSTLPIFPGTSRNLRGQSAAQHAGGADAAQRDAMAPSASPAAKPDPDDKTVDLLAKTFADQAVIAIKHAAVQRDQEARAADRDGRHPEGDASSPSDVQPVFDAIVANATG